EKRERVSSETAYLSDDVLARPNLKVVIHASVTKILFEKHGDETHAVGVEFARNSTSIVYRARARKEVVLWQVYCPAEELNKHGITVIHDLPGVGANLIDHPVVDFYFKDKSKMSPKYFLPQGPWEIVLVLYYTLVYMFTGKGPLGTNWGEAAAFCRSDDPVVLPADEFPRRKPIKDSTWAWNLHAFSIHVTVE
ncbi:hypothetical protein MPER_08858, partial [Moniliophthora perniciosa FA553]